MDQSEQCMEGDTEGVASHRRQLPVTTLPLSLIPPDSSIITPQMLPLLNLQPAHIARVVAAVPGGARNFQDAYPLVPMQEGMLLQHLLAKYADPFVIPTVLEFTSHSRLDAFIEALQKVIDRHDILRTAFLWEQLPQPIQVVYRRAKLPVEPLALDPARSPSEQLQEWLRPERQRLDLRRAPQVRLSIAADEGGVRWYALLQIHHLACDALSHQIIVREVIGHLEGRGQEFPAPIQYGNHVAQTLARAHTHNAERFFREKLGDFREPAVPFGIVDMNEDGGCVDEACETLESTLCRKLRDQAKRHRVSAATLFHTAWGLVLSQTSGRDDVVYGTVLLGRLRMGAGIRTRVGMFFNTLPLRLRLEGINIREAVSRTQQGMLELLAHEQSSLAMAQRCSGICGSMPLFTSLLNYRSGERELDWTNETFGIRTRGRHVWTSYPFALFVDDLADGFELTVQTNRRIDSRRMVGYVRKALQSMVQALEAAPQTPALDVPVLTASERSEVIELLDRSKAGHSCEVTPTIDVQQNYAVPVGEVERVLAEIWGEILGVPHVGRHDNFFELGGDSISSFKLLMKVAEHFCIQSATLSIFRCPSVAKMSQLLECLLPANETQQGTIGMELDEGVL